MDSYHDINEDISIEKLIVLSTYLFIEEIF